MVSGHASICSNRASSEPSDPALHSVSPSDPSGPAPHPIRLSWPPSTSSLWRIQCAWFGSRVSVAYPMYVCVVWVSVSQRQSGPHLILPLWVTPNRGCSWVQSV